MRFQSLLWYSLMVFWCAPLLSQDLDTRLVNSLHKNRSTGLDQPFEWITETASPVSVAMPSLTFGLGLIQRNRSLKSKGLYMAESMAINVFFTFALKYGVDRNRPFEQDPTIIPYDRSSSASWPSGHSSNAFASATALSLAFPKWYVIAPAYAWASAVAYSRIHLGVHYPTDVLAGAGLGAGSAFLSAWLNRKLWNAPKRPAAY